MKISLNANRSNHSQKQFFESSKKNLVIPLIRPILQFETIV